MRRALQDEEGETMPVHGEPHAQPGCTVAQAMASECAALSREFPDVDITWTPMRGFTATPPGEEPLSSPSRTALRCFLALREHRMAR